MKIQCPSCNQPVQPEQINMATDLAFCPECQKAFRISESISLSDVNPKILTVPPKGCWFDVEMDRIVVGASTRSPVAFFLVPFMCVWSGFSLGGIYGSQLVKGEFDLQQSLFGIPFLLGTLLFGSLALMSVFGKVEVSIREDSSVFLGIGKLGWTRLFDWNSVQTVREEASRTEYPGGGPFTLVMVGEDRLSFGSQLNEKRRNFVRNALNTIKATGKTTL